MKYNVIGLVGPIAGGKSQAADVLKDQGYVPFSLSTIVREYAARQLGRRYAELLDPSSYNDVSRRNLQDASRTLRGSHGDTILAEIVTKVIKRQQEEGKISPDASIVIEGIRSPEEVAYLVQSLGMYPIGVTATQEERWKRVQDRVRLSHREGEPQTWEEFRRQDDYELGIQGNNIRDALELCREFGSVIDNTGHSSEYTREAILQIAANSKTTEGQILTKERVL